MRAGRDPTGGINTRKGTRLAMMTSVLRVIGRTLALSSMVLALTVAIAQAQQVRDEWHPAPRDTIDSDTYQGWKQFELNCSRCHGEYAVGTSFAPALVESLKDGGTIPDEPTFITTVCAGRPDKGMPSWCALGLEMDKIQRMYKYIKARADGKIHAGRPMLRADG